jgi:hypothetical protein
MVSVTNPYGRILGFLDRSQDKKPFRNAYKICTIIGMYFQKLNANVMRMLQNHNNNVQRS